MSDVVGVGDDLEDAHAPAALDVDGEDSREEAAQARRRGLGDTSAVSLEVSFAALVRPGASWSTGAGTGERNDAGALAARPEAGGTMLDNTLLLYMSDNGEKHHSLAEEWAMLLLGGDNMGFKTDGRSVTYPGVAKPTNRQTSNMFNAVLHGAGLPTDDFGHNDPTTRIAEGPLAELWGRPRRACATAAIVALAPDLRRRPVGRAGDRTG